MIRFEEVVKILDILTWVEVNKTGERTIYKGRLKDINPQEMADLKVYKVIPASTSKECYLEIDVL